MARARGKKRNPYAALLADYRELIDPKEMAEAFDGDTRLETLLDPEDLESSVAKAAKYLHRNPADPIDSRWLLRILADVLFGDRKRGRRRGSAKWRLWRLVELDVHRNAVERHNPGISDRRAATEIKQRYPQYRHDTVEVVRRRLKEARGYARLHKYRTDWVK